VANSAKKNNKKTAVQTKQISLVTKTKKNTIEVRVPVERAQQL